MDLLSTMPSSTLDDGCTIVVEAIDPVTGGPIAGVQVSAVAILAENLGGGAGVDDNPGPFIYTPGPGLGEA